MTKLKRTRVCTKCRPSFDSGIEAAYQLGMDKAKERYESTVTALTTANKAMLDELNRLDKIYPYPEAVSMVFIKAKFIKTVINFMRKFPGGIEYSQRLHAALEAQKTGLDELNQKF